MKLRIQVMLKQDSLPKPTEEITDVSSVVIMDDYGQPILAAYYHGDQVIATRSIDPDFRLVLEQSGLLSKLQEFRVNIANIKNTGKQHDSKK